MLSGRQPHFDLLIMLTLHDVLRRLSQVFLSYDRRSKFDSVLHMDNDDVLYGFSAINVEFNKLHWKSQPARLRWKKIP